MKDELPRSVGAQYATRDQWRNNSRKNEGMEPKQKQYPAVAVTGDRSKVRCCKDLTRKFETSHVGGATGRTPTIPLSALEKDPRPGHIHNWVILL